MRVTASVVALCLCACRPGSAPTSPAPALRYEYEPSWPDHPAPGVGHGRWLITNSRSDTVSLFDVDQVGQAALPETLRVPVGLNPVEIEAPHHAAILPDGSAYFVGLSQYAPGTGSGPHGAHGTGSVPGELLKYRSDDHRLLGSVRVDRNPGDVAASPDGTLVAVSHFDLLLVAEAAAGKAPSPDARVILVDAQSLEVKARVTVCAAPHGLAFSADGRRLYVACYSDEVAVVRLDEPGYPVTRVKVAGNAGDAFSPTYQPYALSVSPTSGDVFISCLASGHLKVLVAATLTIDESRTQVLGGNPLLSAFTPDGQSLWVPLQGDDTLVEVNPSTGQSRRVAPLPHASCLNVHQVAVSPDARWLLVVCEGDHLGPGSLLVLDAASAATVSATAVGVFPDYVGLVRAP